MYLGNARTTNVLPALLWVTAWLAPCVFGNSEVAFSYNNASPVGPEFWKDLEMEENECGGDSNSPVAIDKSSTCDAMADYKLGVSRLAHWHKLCNWLFLNLLNKKLFVFSISFSRMPTQPWAGMF